ncbi:MAG TPA: TonB-dependent receptor [bacterium]|nr:TonB-dependent receptor [bacterium]HPN43259.1 TonB-dependent receptor [bacterium]
MKTLLTIIFNALLFITMSFAGSIEGVVKSSDHDQALGSVNIKLMDKQNGTASDNDGVFRITSLSPGEYKVHFTCIGYRPETVTVRIAGEETARLTVTMQPMTIPLQEIVITGTRYEKHLQDVSMPLNVVDKDDIMKTAPQDVAGALDTQPGVTLARDGMWGTHVNIRGLSRNNVVLLVDGNRIDTATDLAAGLSMIDVQDVDRIEVVKGAASSLYGTGAVGGVVNVITHDGYYNSKPYYHVNINSGYSSVNNSGSGYAMLSGGAAHWYASLSTMKRSAENVTTPSGEIPNSQFRDENIAAKTGLRFLSNHELKFNYQRFLANDVGIPGGYPLFPDIADVRYRMEKRELYSAEYRVSNLLSVLPLVSVKYYQQKIWRDVENIPHTVTNVPASNGQPPKRINVLSVTPHAIHDARGVNLQTDWILLHDHHVIAGLDAWLKELDSQREKNLRVDVLNPATGEVKQSITQVVGERPLPISTYRSAGVYLQDEFSVLKNISLTLGGRYDKIDINNEETLNPWYQIVNGVRNDSPANQAVLWQEKQAQNHSWSGNLGLLYKMTRHIDWSFSLGKSFRAPYLEERYSYLDLGSLVKIGDPELKPETGTFTDLGVRIHHDRVVFIGDIFLNRLVNQVVEMPSTHEGRNALKNTNIGSSELYGFDLDVQYFINIKLQIFGGAAWVHGQDTYKDVPLPLIAPFNGRAGLAGRVIRYINYQATAIMYAGQDRIADWEYETGGYTTFNLHLTTDPLKFLSLDNRFTLGIENITDKSYRNHLSTNRGAITMEPGRNFVFRWQLQY